MQYQPIPRCAYVVRRGQVPDIAGRSNIFAWSPQLSERPKEFEALSDELTEKIIDLNKPKTDNDPPLQEVRERRIFSAFSNAGQDDVDRNGVPTVWFVRKASGIEISKEERDALWEKFSEANKN